MLSDPDSKIRGLCFRKMGAYAISDYRFLKQNGGWQCQVPTIFSEWPLTFVPNPGSVCAGKKIERGRINYFKIDFKIKPISSKVINTFRGQLERRVK